MSAPMSRYPSKRAPWIITLPCGAVLIQMIVGILVWIAPGQPREQWFFSGLLVGTAIFSLHVLYGTAYDLTKDELIARCGLFRCRIPLTGIQRSPLLEFIVAGDLPVSGSTDRGVQQRMVASVHFARGAGTVSARGRGSLSKSKTDR